HPDFEEKGGEGVTLEERVKNCGQHIFRLFEQGKELRNDIDNLQKCIANLEERVGMNEASEADIYRHLDKTIDAVSQRVDDLAIYRRNHLEYILPDLEARIRDLE